MILNYLKTVLPNHGRNLILILLLIFSIAPVLSGQRSREEPPPLRERLFYGGSFGLQFGTITDIQVSPVIGLWVLPRVAIAVGPDYQYFKSPFGKTNIYGGKGYLQFVVFQDISSIIPLGSHTGIFFHIEDELLSLESAFWKYPSVILLRDFILTPSWLEVV